MDSIYDVRVLLVDVYHVYHSTQSIYKFVSKLQLKMISAK